MFEISESRLNKLTKEELVHLVKWIIPEGEIKKALTKNRQFQLQNNIDCWACRQVHSKLNRDITKRGEK